MAYDIEIRFLGGLTSSQRDAFDAARERWSKVIVSNLPSVVVGADVIDDILIEANGEFGDGPDGVLGQAGPTHLRPSGPESTANLPAKGIMTFDSADLDAMESDGTLLDVITHEMGHVIGIGTVWLLKRLLSGTGTPNATFTGRGACREFGTLRRTGSTPVPIENTGGEGTADSHWSERVFGNELMSGFVRVPGNPLSRMTVASLEDIGYTVNLAAAESYNLPNLRSLDTEGSSTSRSVLGRRVLPVLDPKILPRDSLR